MNEIKKTGTIERTRNKWNKKWNKKKIEYTGWWNKRYLRKFRCKFNDFKTKIYILGKTACFKKERELRLSAKEKINKRERFKEKVELLDHLLEGLTKVSKLLTDLDYGKI